MARREPDRRAGSGAAGPRLVLPPDRARREDVPHDLSADRLRRIRHVVVLVDRGRGEDDVAVALEPPEGRDLGAEEVGRLSGHEKGELARVDRGAEGLRHVVEVREPLDRGEQAGRLRLRLTGLLHGRRSMTKEALERREPVLRGCLAEAEGDDAGRSPLEEERRDEDRRRSTGHRLDERVGDGGDLVRPDQTCSAVAHDVPREARLAGDGAAEALRGPLTGRAGADEGDPGGVGDEEDGGVGSGEPGSPPGRPHRAFADARAARELRQHGSFGLGGLPLPRLFGHPYRPA